MNQAQALANLGNKIVRDPETPPLTPEHTETHDQIGANDNQVDVGIKPVTEGNRVFLRLCSMSLVFNCCTKDTKGEN
jgi:hypothetical protein